MWRGPPAHPRQTLAAACAWCPSGSKPWSLHPFRAGSLKANQPRGCAGRAAGSIPMRSSGGKPIPSRRRAPPRASSPRSRIGSVPTCSRKRTASHSGTCSTAGSGRGLIARATCRASRRREGQGQRGWCVAHPDHSIPHLLVDRTLAAGADSPDLGDIDDHRPGIVVGHSPHQPTVAVTQDHLAETDQPTLKRFAGPPGPAQAGASS